MTSTIKRQLCAKCMHAKGVAACNGCQQMFCLNHFVEHRDELSKLMDTISVDHDSLRNDLCEANAEQPYLVRIAKWEEEAIKRVHMAADDARSKLRAIIHRKRKEFKYPVETLATELQFSRASDSYTENDIERWTEQLKSLQEELKAWSLIRLEEEAGPENMIGLLQVYHQQDESSQVNISRSHSMSELSDELSLIKERFNNTSSDITLMESNSVARCYSKRKISYTRFLYGVNHYQSGKHTIRLLVENRGESPLFFGILAATKKYDQSYFNPNNSSVFGWYNFETQVICGKSYLSSEENTLLTGDELTLTIDCDEQKIVLQHSSTKRSFDILVKMEKCPFPWKMMLGLSNLNDCIRILD